MNLDKLNQKLFSTSLYNFEFTDYYYYYYTKIKYELVNMMLTTLTIMMRC